MAMNEDQLFEARTRDVRTYVHSRNTACTLYVPALRYAYVTRNYGNVTITVTLRCRGRDYGNDGNLGQCVASVLQ